MRIRTGSRLARVRASTSRGRPSMRMPARRRASVRIRLGSPVMVTHASWRTTTGAGSESARRMAASRLLRGRNSLPLRADILRRSLEGKETENCIGPTSLTFQSQAPSTRCRSSASRAEIGRPDPPRVMIASLESSSTMDSLSSKSK